ncbi:MAG: hypothetical protein BGN88_04790 [Clostridiales bacterium 43-6]|nr:MAG: hypothetical protein BGN88_04790 [Clostridiales bacterium 43-6]
MDTVLGKDGFILIKGTDIVVVCGTRDVFRCNVSEAEAGELLSGDGVLITGTGQDGMKQSVVAYYTYRW